MCNMFRKTSTSEKLLTELQNTQEELKALQEEHEKAKRTIQVTVLNLQTRHFYFLKFEQFSVINCLLQELKQIHTKCG